jgi:hypothetical protein
MKIAPTLYAFLALLAHYHVGTEALFFRRFFQRIRDLCRNPAPTPVAPSAPVAPPTLRAPASPLAPMVSPVAPDGAPNSPIVVSPAATAPKAPAGPANAPTKAPTSPTGGDAPAAAPKSAPAPTKAPVAAAPGTVLCNVTVSVGSKSNPAGKFVNLGVDQSLANVINCLGPNDTEVHTQSSHVWWYKAPLELVFNFSQTQDVSGFLFWNYFEEGYDVDSIALDFFGAQNQRIASYTVVPRLGLTTAAGASLAERITLDATLRGIRSISAVLNATNGELDFQNLLFVS